jgi:hypothetical protein
MVATAPASLTLPPELDPELVVPELEPPELELELSPPELDPELVVPELEPPELELELVAASALASISV